MRKLLLGFVFSAVAMMAGDVTGKWTGNMRPNGQDGEHPVFLVLKQDGAALSGSGGPNEEQQNPFEGGKVDGEDLTFAVAAGSGKFSFKLKVKGEEITGEVEYSRNGQTDTGKVSLKRAK